MMQPYQQSRSASRSLSPGSHAREQHSISCMKHTGVTSRRCTSRRATVQATCLRTQCNMERMASFVLAAWMGLSPLQAYAAADAVQTEAPKASVETLRKQPLGPGQQSAATGASPDLPPLPTDFPPLPDIKPAPIDEFALGNGLRVFLLEDHELPVVQGSLLMRGGQRASPPDKVGVATISANMQRSGGSQQHPGARLDAELELRAASIEGGAAGESIGMGFECLSEDVADVMGLFSEVILQPALPQAKLDLFKSQVLNLLQHLNDSSGAIPRRELAKLIYGRDSVFSRTPSPAQIRGLARDDVVAYLSKWERPDAAVFGISGDFDKREMKTLIEQRFGRWQPAPGQPAQPPAIPNTPLPQQDTANTVYLVNRPGQTQASIATGEVGINILDPDACALDVLGDIFNGFGGRLFDELRSREGLAYSVSGGWSTTPADHVGLFTAGGETAKPAEFLVALQKVLQAAREEAPPSTALATAKAQTMNSFVFNFASSGAQLQRRLIYTLLGVPKDFLFQYRAGIEAVTTEDVLAAAQRHLHPDQQIIVMAADKTVAEPALRQKGWQVQLLDVDLPA